MRSHLLTVAAGAGLALSVLAATPAVAITSTTPAGIRQAADALDPTQAVHCRDYLHRHKNERKRSYGCAEGETPPVRRGSSSTPPSLDPGLLPLAPASRPAGNFVNPMNPQDRSGTSNPQNLTTPRSFNPQDMR
jgi:hypothetical protein